MIEFSEADEMRARHAVLYDALTHCRASAKKHLLPDADREEGLQRVKEIVTKAVKALDDLTFATRFKGMEIADEEILGLCEAAGGVGFLTPEGQIRCLGALKRLATQKPTLEIA